MYDSVVNKRFLGIKIYYIYIHLKLWKRREWKYSVKEEKEQCKSTVLKIQFTHVLYIFLMDNGEYKITTVFIFQKKTWREGREHFYYETSIVYSNQKVCHLQLFLKYDIEICTLILRLFWSMPCLSHLDSYILINTICWNLRKKRWNKEIRTAIELEVCSPQIGMLKPSRQCAGAGGQVFGGWLGHGGGALIKGISVLRKERVPGPSHQVRTQQGEDSCLWIRTQFLTRHWICQCLHPGLPASRTARNKYLLLRPPSLWYSVIGAQTDWDLKHEIESQRN